MPTDRFDRDQLIAQAIETTGEDDFGEGSWQEGLDVFLDSLVNEARLNDLGVEIATSDVSGYLGSRLAVNALAP